MLEKVKKVNYILIFLIALLNPIFSNNEKNEYQLRIDSAREYYNAQEYQKSIGELQEAIQSTNSNPELAYAYHFIGYLYTSQNDFENAILNYHKSLEYDKNYLPSVESLGNIYVYFQDDEQRFASALQYLLKAETLKSENYNVYYNIAYIFSVQQKYSQAIQYLDKALYYGFENIEYIKSNLKVLENTSYYQNLVTNSHKFMEAKNLFSKAKKSESTPNYDLTISYYKQAAQGFLDSLGESSLWLAASYYNLAIYFDKRNIYDFAIQYYDLSLPIYKHVYGENSLYAAWIYKSLGSLYEKKTNYDSAIQYYNSALSLFQSIYGEQSQSIAELYNNLGDVYYKILDYETSIKYYKASLIVYRQFYDENESVLAVIYNGLGLAYDKKGEPNKAIEYYNKAIKVRLNIIGEEYPKLSLHDMGEVLNRRLQEPFDLTKEVSVLYASPRQLRTNVMPSCSNQYFSTNLGKEQNYGSCKINVPVVHDVGNLDEDSSGDPDRYFQFKGFAYHNHNSFFEKVANEDFPEVLVFVHGFNVDFEQAVLRAAQLKFDLKFPGRVVLFTWPAGAQEGSIITKANLHNTYIFNQDNARRSIPYFLNFMLNLTNTNKKVHLVVHSMGHQVVIPALGDLSKIKKDKVLQEVVFNAPDFDLERFKKYSDSLLSISKRVTVYCSPGDNALFASSKVNQNQRLGNCAKVKGVDMINVNPIDAPLFQVAGLGHGYYSSRPIITDLYQLILGVDVSKRLYIRKSLGGSEDYILRR